MRKNKKGFIVLLIAVIAVFVTGTVMTTYAWFLSRYSHQYSIMLESESPIIIKYESDLVFGSEGAADNVLIPAKAKTLVGSEQQTLSPIDVFDTSLVGHPAQAVRITADGAYWAGSVSTQEPKIGLFRSDIYAYTASFLGGDVLSDHLEEFSDITAITEENLLSLLSAERSAYSSTPNS